MTTTTMTTMRELARAHRRPLVLPRARSGPAAVVVCGAAVDVAGVHVSQYPDFYPYVELSSQQVAAVHRAQLDLQESFVRKVHEWDTIDIAEEGERTTYRASRPPAEQSPIGSQPDRSSSPNQPSLDAHSSVAAAAHATVAIGADSRPTSAFSRPASARGLQPRPPQRARPQSAVGQ